MSYSDIIRELSKRLSFELKENEPMSAHTTFKIGGCAELFVTVFNREQLSAIKRICTENTIPLFIIGRGSNLLISDNGIKGVVLSLDGDFKKIELENDKIVCGCAVPLSKLCGFALDNGLSGLEFAYGIPGSTGGAAFMNAGAYGGEMKDVVISCEHMDEYGNIASFTKEELSFSYRHSVYKENGCTVISVTLKLINGSYDEIRAKMDDYMSRRRTKQPLEYPSAGSVFKRPAGNFAGTLIEQCGLKGTSIGGAMVSEKHAGFIVNTGGATCENVKNLIALVQDTVKEKTGYFLEREIIYIDK